MKIFQRKINPNRIEFTLLFSMVITVLSVSCETSIKNEITRKTSLEILNEKIDSCYLNDFLCRACGFVNNSAYFEDLNEMKSGDPDAHEAFKFATSDDLFGSKSALIRKDDNRNQFKMYNKINSIDTSALVITLHSPNVDLKEDFDIAIFDFSTMKLTDKYEFEELLAVLLDRCENRNKEITIKSDEKIAELRSILKKLNSISDIFVIETIFWKEPKETKSYDHAKDEMGKFEPGYLLQKVYHHNYSLGETETFYLKSGNSYMEFGDLTDAIYRQSKYALEDVLSKSIILRK